ncbi:MAG TPA: response regulator [Polyangiaceae bacterium]|nr:response regulator [Polyangiaceae bacterium]
MGQERKPKILLVDDSSTVLIMEEMLLRSKYDVVKATGGAQALRIAAEQKPDLVLLDIVMPAMDGLETCRLLRAMEATRSTPIIMVTTRGERKTMDAATAAGANGYVTKPIDQKELLSKVDQYLGAKP